ncbi:MAG: hypothetical protein FWG05_06080, partial [Kiritimatiellaeota bacterium]|nr:hypothetical protein [Kiritimatiellota bacterium]
MSNKRGKFLFRRIRRKFHDAIEYAAVGLAGAVVPRLSRRGELRLAKFLGAAAFHLARGTRRISLANLNIVYGAAKTRAEKLAIAKAATIHTLQIMLDYFWFSRDTRTRLERHCVCEDSVVNGWLDGTAPGFFVTAHIGNWEVAGNYVSFRGRKLSSVYRPIGTEKTLARLSEFRKSTGQQMISKEGAGMGILRALKSGGIVALVMDQHTDLRDGGIYFDFFGLPAAFTNVCGIFANRMKIPVCVAGAFYDETSDTY